MNTPKPTTGEIRPKSARPSNVLAVDFRRRADEKAAFKTLAADLQKFHEAAQEMRRLCLDILRQGEALGLDLEDIGHPLNHVENVAFACKLASAHEWIAEEIAEGAAWPQ